MNFAVDPEHREPDRHDALRQSAAEKIHRLVIRELFEEIFEAESVPVARGTRQDFAAITTDTRSAIAAGGGPIESEKTSTRSLPLVVDRTSPGNRWPGSANAVEIWDSLKATVDLLFGADERFASVSISGSDEQVDDRLDDWMYEAIALGTGELPDFHRKVAQPSSRGSIPLLATKNFRLDQPIRVALHVSDAGQTALGCLVFVLG